MYKDLIKFYNRKKKSFLYCKFCNNLKHAQFCICQLLPFFATKHKRKLCFNQFKAL